MALDALLLSDLGIEVEPTDPDGQKKAEEALRLVIYRADKARVAAAGS